MNRKVRRVLIAVALLLGGAGRVGAEYLITTLNGFGVLNDAGQMAGGDGNRALLYSGGTTTTIGPPGSGALGINASGQVVGWADIGRDWGERAFLYSGGQFTDLGTLGGDTSRANAINDAGQVVGTANTKFGDHAFLYSNGKMTALGTLGGTGATANAINNKGQIVGESDTSGGGGEQAFLYSNGKMTALSGLGAPSTAVGINDSGQIVGDANGHAFLYSSGKGTDLGTLGGKESFANGINNAGQVVGEADTGSGPLRHAFLFINGKMTDLNSLLPANSGWLLESATAINNKGQIAGWGTAPGGASAAFLLTPVPEPGGLALLGLGGVGLAGHAWRKRRRSQACVVRICRVGTAHQRDGISR